MAAFGGNAADVPDWPDDDFDSIFIVRLRTETQGRRSITFEHGQSTGFPSAASRP